MSNRLLLPSKMLRPATFAIAGIAALILQLSCPAAQAQNAAGDLARFHELRVALDDQLRSGECGPTIDDVVKSELSQEYFADRPRQLAEFDGTLRLCESKLVDRVRAAFKASDESLPPEVAQSLVRGSLALAETLVANDVVSLEVWGVPGMSVIRDPLGQGPPRIVWQTDDRGFEAIRRVNALSGQLSFVKVKSHPPGAKVVIRRDGAAADDKCGDTDSNTFLEYGKYLFLLTHDGKERKVNVLVDQEDELVEETF